jgi:hypothetical protein
MADAVVSGTNSAIAGRPPDPRGGSIGATMSFGSSPSRGSSPLARMTNSPGRPIDAATRGFMESRFGHDFSKVRVHTGGAAASAADAMQAHALASGTDIAFAPGMYRPGARAGMHLLAHELAHVVQQPRVSAPSPVRLKKKPADKPFYQEALDRLALEKRATQVTLSTGGVIDMFGIVPIVEKFIEFAEAIEAGDVKAVPLRLAEFVKMDTSKLSVVFPSDPLVNTTITRLLLLGLEGDAQTFRAWYLKHEQETASPSMRRKDFLSQDFIWEQVYDELTNKIPEKGGDPAVKVLDALILLFGQMRDELVGLDETAIKEDRRQRAEISELFGDMLLNSDISISVYADHLYRLLKQCFGAIQRAYQVVLDEATADLSAGKGTKFFDIAKDRLHNKIRGLISPKEKEKNVELVKVEVTRSEFKKGGGKHVDYFATGKAAAKREAVIQFYDSEMIEWLATEKELDFARIFTIRSDQLAVIERIYGLAKDEKTGQPTTEATENKTAIAKLGKQGLRLESDDDWRRFLTEKYQTARDNGAKPAQALSSVVKLLETFLHVFTTHSPYNIDDFHDNYLSRQFPRAMTGQLIQDCGVYALRIAYMLSLLRQHKELELRIRFIMLPVHVGLIITGKPGAGLPTYFAHNDTITEYSDARITELRDAWVTIDEHGELRPGPEAAATAAGAETGDTKTGAAHAVLGEKDEAQFLAELAGGEFIPGADMPFKLLEGPKPKERAKPGDIKADLWKFYTKEVAPTKLFGPETQNPKSPVYQFHLKYLKVLDLIKVHYNQSVVPFWNNTGFNAWQTHGPRLIEASKKIDTAKNEKERKAAQTAYAELQEKYQGVVETELTKVTNKYASVSDAESEITTLLQAHPEALAGKIGVIHTARADTVLGSTWWSKVVFEHFGGLLDRSELRAPYGRKEDWLWPID